MVDGAERPNDFHTDEYLKDDNALDHAIRLLLESNFYTAHSDRMVNLVMLLVETVSRFEQSPRVEDSRRYWRHCLCLLTRPSYILCIPLLTQRHSHDSHNATTKLHVLLHILLQNGHQKPHVFKLLRQSRSGHAKDYGRPFIQILIEILSRTEEEAHASGKDSSVEGLVGLEATELLYEILRVKRLSKEELREYPTVLGTVSAMGDLCVVNTILGCSVLTASLGNPYADMRLRRCHSLAQLSSRRSTSLTSLRSSSRRGTETSDTTMPSSD